MCLGSWDVCSTQKDATRFYRQSKHTTALVWLITLVGLMVPKIEALASAPPAPPLLRPAHYTNPRPLLSSRHTFAHSASILQNNGSRNKQYGNGDRYSHDINNYIRNRIPVGQRPDSG